MPPKPLPKIGATQSARAPARASSDVEDARTGRDGEHQSRGEVKGKLGQVWSIALRERAHEHQLGALQ
jgi:hypothetical protein